MIPPHRADLPPRSEEDQAAFFAEVLARARQAAERLVAIEHDIILADKRIRLRFAGDALERQLMPALSHRRVTTEPDARPDLLIHVWDSASSGVANGAPPVEKYCLSERGDIWTFGSRRYRSAFHYSEFSLNLMDVERGEAVFWLNSPDELAYWTIASPFRTLFHWLAEHHGGQLVHAAAIGLGGRGVLITGRGGVGKSSTALAAAEAGFDYVGDDYVLLTMQGGRVRARSLYRTAKIDPADLSRYPRLADGAGHRLAGAGDEKAVLFLSDPVVESVAIEAVLTPRFGTREEAGLEPVDPHFLMGAACYTTIAQLPHAGPKTSAFLEEAFRRIPGRRLVLGRDRTSVTRTLRTLLANGVTAEPRAITPAPMPLVSVVMPVFNGVRFLGEAVASIVAQNYPALELILVDDGSPENIAAVAEGLPIQPRVIHQHNQGPAAARNVGIRAASGDLIAFLDVDDLWPPHRLATAVRWALDHPASDVVIGRAQLFRHEVGLAPVFVGSPAESFDDYIGAAVFRRRAFNRAGLFDPLLRFAEDSDWFARAAHLGLTVDRLDMTTLQVRRHEDNVTRDRDTLELTPLRLLKNALDLKRAAATGSAGGVGAPPA